MVKSMLTLAGTSGAKKSIMNSQLPRRVSRLSVHTCSNGPGPDDCASAYSRSLVALPVPPELPRWSPVLPRKVVPGSFTMKLEGASSVIICVTQAVASGRVASSPGRFFANNNGGRKIRVPRVGLGVKNYR